ncbi:MAG: NUDIX hydrolase [Terrimicrobiaceae bacterium]
MKGSWELLNTRPLCETPYLQVAEETVATPTRPHGVKWFVSYRPEAAVIAPQLPDGRLVMIRQERVAVRETLWEFPAGQLDHGNILTTASRELDEEAGLMAEKFIPLGSFFTSPGFTTERCHLFLATGCRPLKDRSPQDDGEAILETRAFEPRHIHAMVASGEIHDANSLAIYARLIALGHLKP